jgi:hypothetical protein
MPGGTRRQDGVLDVSNHNRGRFSLQGALSAEVQASLWRFVIGETARNRYGEFHSLRYSKVSSPTLLPSLFQFYRGILDVQPARLFHPSGLTAWRRHSLRA